MVKLKQSSDVSLQKTPKGTKTRYTKSLTKLPSPANRRKSLATVLPTPKLEKKLKAVNKRQSVAAFPVPQFEETAENPSLEVGSSIAVNTKGTSRKNKSKKSLSTSLSLHNENPMNLTSKSTKKVNMKLTVPPKFPGRTSGRRLSMNDDFVSIENKIEDKPLPDNKKKQNKKKASLVLAPKSKSPQIKNHAKKTPLVLAYKDESSGLNSESKEKVEPRINKSNIISLKKSIKLEKTLNLSELENQYNILIKDVKNAVDGVIKFATNNPKLQNQLFNTEIPLFLQINSIKIPNTRGPVKHVFRVPLEHSISTTESDICLIVPDVKGIPNKELERHQEHYEKLLADKGVKNIKKIMTFYEFRTEYETFELKNRLADLYDIFLVDGKISGKVVHKAGKIFYKKRKVPNPIKLKASNLAHHIENSLKKVYFDMTTKSDSCMVQFGHSKMTTKQLIENVYSVVEFLDKKFPGKLENVKSLYVYAHRGSSIPIYVSLKNPNEVKVPTIKHRKPKAYKSFTGELTTQYNADVVVRPSGKVIVRRTKSALEPQGDDEITDQDILNANKQEVEEKKQGKKRKVGENIPSIKQENVNSESKNKKIKKEKNEVKQEVVQIKKRKQVKVNSMKKPRKNIKKNQLK